MTARMAVFMIVMPLLWVVLHVYVGRRLIGGSGLGGRGRLFAWGVIAVMGLGAAAWFNRINWAWAITGVAGIVLVFGAPSPLPLQKAGACLLKFVGAVEPGAGRLHWFLGPRPLRRLAGRKSHA